MLLNEFTALGKIPIVSESMSYLPGYNVRVLLVIQAPSQLREVYGPYAAETMLKSVAARIVFAPKDYPDAKEISDELGFDDGPRALALEAELHGAESSIGTEREHDLLRTASSALVAAGSEGNRQ